MSIYASAISIDDDDHDDPCARWVPLTPDEEKTIGWKRCDSDGSRWRYDPDLACTCRCGPIAYQGSHVLPSDDDPRGGNLDLAEIPPWIGPGRGFIEDGPPRPWLRVSVNDSEVVLDRPQVTKIARYLSEWVSRVEESLDGEPE